MFSKFTSNSQMKGVHNPLAFSVKNQSAESPIAKFAISGLVSWSFEFLLAGHFVEFLKVEKQATGLSYKQITRNITQHKGFVGIFDGFFPWGSIYSVMKGCMFGWGQAVGRNFFDGKVSDSTANVLSGGVGGFVQGITLSPTLLLKTRVMTDPRFRVSGGTLQTTIASCKIGTEICRTEGAATLMKGSMVFATKRLSDWTTRFLFVELIQNQLKTMINDRPLNQFEKCSAAFAGGAVSAFVTLPIDVLVATFQKASKAGVKMQVTDIWKEQLRKGKLSYIVVRFIALFYFSFSNCFFFLNF
eukprot:TRINITY_DN1442_c1_g1_i1.p1 TRINITY_DN1442_c1_g1~~TRINITY_DN1442_c1_g1_i1.p1  ORF type:complete len:319 (+),score=92.04 TRINITY_DN1442_c1_g1_i1:56-958(+)